MSFNGFIGTNQSYITQMSRCKEGFHLIDKAEFLGQFQLQLSYINVPVKSFNVKEHTSGRLSGMVFPLPKTLTSQITSTSSVLSCL